MNEMIDLVAEALFAHDGCTEWDAVTDELREPWRGKARVAIATTREPTVEMVFAAYRAWDAFGEGAALGPKEVLAIWQAMIDEALK